LEATAKSKAAVLQMAQEIRTGEPAFEDDGIGLADVLEVMRPGGATSVAPSSVPETGSRGSAKRGGRGLARKPVRDGTGREALNGRCMPPEIWRDGRVPARPPSTFFSLVPMALDTPLVESLPSYLMRLASLNRVSVGAVVAKLGPLIGDRLGRRWTYRPRLSRTLLDRGTSLIGPSLVATVLVESLATATGRSDLGRLTMLDWRDIIPRRGFLPVGQASVRATSPSGATGGICRCCGRSSR
jgi:hypothetical protein